SSPARPHEPPAFDRGDSVMNTAMSAAFAVAGTALPADLSAPLVMPKRRVLRAYLTEIRYEFLHMLRTPVFVIPFLLLPAGVYLFSLMMASRQFPGNPAVATFLLVGFSVFALTGPTLFGVGCPLAVERDAGLMKLKRAQPAPTGAYLIAKMTMATLFAAIAMGTILLAALCAGRLDLSAARLLGLSAVLIAGSVPFAAIGLCIGAHVRGSAAPGITHLLYLPMLYLSGLFFPLPAALSRWAIVWPAFHLDRIALGIAGVAAPASVPTVASVAYLLGITAVCGAIASRRLAQVG
ncbi:MAG: ABC transporter permease, partial [Steroidobacteraceae bacterium]